MDGTLRKISPLALSIAASLTATIALAGDEKFDTIAPGTLPADWTCGVTGAFTTETLNLYGLGLPFMLAGIWSGFKLYGKIDDDTFRKAVLMLLLLAGLSLIVPALIVRGA